jgi:hypothetical protein
MTTSGCSEEDDNDDKKEGVGHSWCLAMRVANHQQQMIHATSHLGTLAT